MQRRTMKSLTVTGIAITEFLMLLFLPIANRGALAAERQIIWQGREQFVALERQDSNPDGPAAPNDHPADMTLERLTAFLGSLDLRPAENEKPEPLFTKATLEILAPQLQQGLRRASPGEDVTFAIIGLHQALFGFAKSPKVTTGRFFYKGGRLNIIVGLAQKDVNDRDDRRLSPFTPGARRTTAAGDWTILPHEGRGDITLTRRDWVVSSAGGEAPAMPPSPAPISAAPAPSQTAVSDTQPDKARTPAERLIILNELKNKGLISEDEYRGKRREILNGL